MATMDSPNGKRGPETLSFVAEQTGGFTLEISGFDAKTEKGKYSIRLEAPRAATAKDKRRVEVERLFAAGMAALAESVRAETAIKQLSEARAGREELADAYMAGLTGRQIANLQNQTEVSAAVREINKLMEAANNSLQEGQKLSARSKADSLPARAKLNEALVNYRAVQARAADKALRDKLVQLGSSSQQTANFLKAMQLFAKSSEATALDAIAQTHFNLGELREQVDYLKRALALYQETGRFLADANITGIDLKQYPFQLKNAEGGTAGNLAGTLHRLGNLDEALKYQTMNLTRLRALQQEAPDPQLKLREATASTKSSPLIWTKKSRTSAKPCNTPRSTRARWARSFTTS